MALWSLREQPPPKLKLTLELVGGILFVAIWWLVTVILELPKSVLPTPWDVAKTFPVLLLGNDSTLSFTERLSNNLLWHAWLSIELNIMSYVEAVVIAIPLGFLMGHFGPIRALCERWLVAFRYLPITAFTSIIVVWFGIHHLAMVQFLTLGVLVYLLPAVVLRIDEVEQVYYDTAKTCGASRWQRIRTVSWPLVSARLSDDCKGLVPMTWTYLLIAEGFNLNVGGLGALAGTYMRASRWDFVFALVIVILTIGFCQDKIWSTGDRKIYSWKYS